MCLRYIDDLFLIWTGTKEQLKDFVTNLNNQYPSIKFSCQILNKSIDFLDTTVYVKNRRLHTTIFTKLTDKQNYLHYKSEHSLPLKSNIPFGQILRIKRICSEALEFLRNCTKIISRFTQRGYPESITQEAYYKTTSRQKTLFKPKKGKDHKEYHSSYIHQNTTSTRSSHQQVLSHSPIRPKNGSKNNLVKDQF